MVEPTSTPIASVDDQRPRRFAGAISAIDPFVEVVSVSCGDLAMRIESGTIDEALVDEVRTYCAPLRDAGVDAVILGCTHYPLVRPIIQRMLGPETTKALAKVVRDQGNGPELLDMLTSLSVGAPRGDGYIDAIRQAASGDDASLKRWLTVARRPACCSMACRMRSNG